MDDVHEDFRALLRRHRRFAGLTQEELAERSGLSVRGISDLERGARARPHRDTIEMLAGALGLPADERTRFAAAGRTRRREQAASTDAAAWPGLPAPPNALLGRAADLAKIETLLGQDDVRLITLTGPGGVGKTRLAIEIARNRRPFFPDGVQFVSLAPLRDPELVMSAVAQALAIPEAGATSPFEQVKAHVGAKRMLLVLDNFEHVLDVAPRLGDLLSACPDLAALTTSRVLLRVSGEHEYPVPPLALAGSRAGADTAWPPTSPAAALFVERMAAIAPHFTLDPHDAPAIATICARLDGLPLAIELAAARARHLTPAELARRLDRRLAFLTDGPRDLPARQRTLRDAIAWSYDLLSPGARTLFRRLSVFAGGWTLEAAELLTGEDAASPVIDDLRELVNSSLAQVQRSPAGCARFRMLETIREFAEERLVENGEEPAVRDRHAEVILDFSERAERGLQSGERPTWSIRSVEELDDVRAALRWLIDRRDAERAPRMVGNLDWFWDVVARDHEGWAWTESALALDGIDRAGLAHARALNAAGALVWNLGDFARSDTLLTESVAHLRALDDGRSLGQALLNLGLTKQYLGETAAARSAIEEAVGLLERAGDSWGQALALFAYAETMVDDDPGAARDAYQRSLTLFRAMNEPWGIAQAITGLGGLAMRQRDYASARALLEEGLAIRRLTSNAHAIALSLTSLGELARREGDPARAVPLLNEGLARFRELSDGEHIAWTLYNLGLALLAAGSLDTAASALDECLTLRVEHGNIEQIARTIAGIARLALARGRVADAARLFGAASVMRDRNGITAPRDEDGDEEQRAVASIAALTETTEPSLAWMHGESLGVEAAVRAAHSESAPRTS